MNIVFAQLSKPSKFYEMLSFQYLEQDSRPYLDCLISSFIIMTELHYNIFHV